jgi:hypothetical protein
MQEQPSKPEGRRTRLVGRGIRRPAFRAPRWIVRLALLVAVALGGLVYVMELDPSRMLGFLAASLVFVAACAAVALLVVALAKLVRR